MRFITWATSPWGQSVPTHIVWGLIWVAVIAGLFFMIVHSLYLIVVKPPKRFAERKSRSERGSDSGARAEALACGAAVSLDHGGVDVHAAVYGVPAQGGHPV
jgi:hypothetical protein